MIEEIKKVSSQKVDELKYAIKIINGESSGPRDMVLRCDEATFNLACDRSKPFTVVEYFSSGQARCMQLSYYNTVDNSKKQAGDRIEGIIFDGNGETYHPDICAILLVLTRFWYPSLCEFRIHPACKVSLQTVDGCTLEKIIPEFVKQTENSGEYVEDFSPDILSAPSETGVETIKEGIPYKRVYVHKGKFTEEVVVAMCSQIRVRGYPIYEEVLSAT